MLAQSFVVLEPPYHGSRYGERYATTCYVRWCALLFLLALPLGSCPRGCGPTEQAPPSKINAACKKHRNFQEWRSYKYKSCLLPGGSCARANPGAVRCACPSRWAPSSGVTTAARARALQRESQNCSALGPREFTKRTPGRPVAEECLGLNCLVKAAGIH